LIRELREQRGLTQEALAELMQTLGGVTIRVPTTARGNLLQKLSPTTVRQLVREFGGERFRVPNDYREQRVVRIRRVQRLLDGRQTYRSVARRLRIAPSTVLTDSSR
jgi:hypothetical protein